MSDSRKKFWEDYIARLSPCALVECLFFVNRLLDSEEVVEESSFDFFSDLFDMLHREVFFRYAKMVYDSISSSSSTFLVDASCMVSEFGKDT